MLKPNRAIAGATAFGIAALIGAVHGQVGRGTTEWLTAGGDAQRTFSIRTDPKISVASMSKPGFELQWSKKLDNRVRGANGLQHGVSANGVTLFVPMSIVTGSSNNVYALDNDTGYVVWQRTFDAALPAATAQCPGGITAGATRIVPLTPPAITLAMAGLGGGGGRAAQGYRSVIGESGAGAPVEVRGGGPGRGAQGAQGARGLPPVAPSSAPGAQGAAPPAAGAAPPAGGVLPPITPARGGGGGGGGGGFGPPAGAAIPGATAEQLGGGRGGLARASGVVYAIASDGVLHVLGLPSGKDMQKPAEFFPANARWTDTIAVNTTLYATTTGSCGGAANAIWAIDLESEGKPVVSWKSNGGPIVGRLAFSNDGTVFAAVGAGTATGDGKANAIVALDGKTLQVKDWFTQPNAQFVTGPSIFKQGDREIVAAATRDGRILLLNASSLGGADHATALHASAAVSGLTGDALATWQEMTISAPPPLPPAVAGAPGTAPPAAGAPGGPAPQPNITYGARWILATTTTGVAAFKVSDSGGLSLERGWAITGLSSPSTPIVVNGVVFALATGRPASPAALKAYEGTTGKLLWESKAAMKSPASPGSFWSALSQIYVGTNDGTLYAFGFVDERR
jgi:outer membrane protein assembly factor BamB